MRKIKSIEDALSLFELNAIIQEECNRSGDYRKGNKAYENRKIVIKYLLENQGMDDLKVFYKSDNLFVRLSAATYLAPIDNNNCYQIVKAIMEADAGWASFNAKYTLQEWSKLSSPDVYTKILAD